ncbi:hypothetical protein HOP50_01g01120 [Chloropicon primus]|nr:hypothetical protein HOP50_01g01120 [Chloropicon primus]
MDSRGDSPHLGRQDYGPEDDDEDEVEVMTYDSDGSLMPVSAKDVVQETDLEAARLEEARAWLRQVEEENELKLRERLQEQRKEQQEHFRKLDIRDDYLPPHLAFGSLPTGQSMLRKRKGEEEDDSNQKGSPVAPESNTSWTEAGRNNQVAALGGSTEATSAKQLGKRKSGTSCWGMTIRLFLLILYTICVVILSLWVFHKTQGKDSNQIPWKWLEFTEDDKSVV